MNRSLLKQIGVNLLRSDPTSGFQFGIGQGVHRPTTGRRTRLAVQRRFAASTGGPRSALPASCSASTSLASLDLAAKDGLVTILAEPNLTALSGETASFLAGGEFPIPISQSLGAVTIEYKQYGVGLAFTPIVLADGRISMRVRPEVSELSQRRRGPAQRLHRSGADHAPGRNHGRARLGPVAS